MRSEAALDGAGPKERIRGESLGYAKPPLDHAVNCFDREKEGQNVGHARSVQNGNEYLPLLCMQNQACVSGALLCITKKSHGSDRSETCCCQFWTSPMDDNDACCTRETVRNRKNVRFEDIAPFVCIAVMQKSSRNGMYILELLGPHILLLGQDMQDVNKNCIGRKLQMLKQLPNWYLPMRN
ncbi:hypothetical protein BU24DRAFT_152494 [Aaosphaeria arxii CBS 175.79]|uniref:Uncharacterized protein n=1 Tax=Aaosphaeria arxii CBS 175.79 TaxID=1450172 RepID=A0A6A5XWM5_9PLEO|nr:uncharacterized protein BU24DRAFT_152494 [Aaosphaeria arxii CBS 175.79]KAF2017562.1 hypothetical protein BU24DRAFT_152494 [Aaosphaeria arxii CBS 175.79]